MRLHSMKSEKNKNSTVRDERVCLEAMDLNNSQELHQVDIRPAGYEKAAFHLFIPSLVCSALS